jgi:hypothetical protein
LYCSSKSRHAVCLDEDLKEARFTLEDIVVNASKFKSVRLAFSHSPPD